MLSAYMKTVEALTASGRSLIYVENNNGPKQDLCGTNTYLIVANERVKASNSTRLLTIKKIGGKPQQLSPLKAIVTLSTVSNAFLRSMKTAPEMQPLSIPLYHLSVFFIKQVAVE